MLKISLPFSFDLPAKTVPCAYERINHIGGNPLNKQTVVAQLKKGVL